MVAAWVLSSTAAHPASRCQKKTSSMISIDGVPGFALKAEPRAAVVFPRDLRLRPAETDPLHRGRKLVRLAFSLPRGSYATLVVRRLIGPAHIRPL